MIQVTVRHPARPLHLVFGGPAIHLDPDPGLGPSLKMIVLRCAPKRTAPANSLHMVSQPRDAPTKGAGLSKIPWHQNDLATATVTLPKLQIDPPILQKENNGQDAPTLNTDHLSDPKTVSESKRMRTCSTGVTMGAVRGMSSQRM